MSTKYNNSVEKTQKKNDRGGKPSKNTALASAEEVRAKNWPGTEVAVLHILKRL